MVYLIGPAWTWTCLDLDSASASHLDYYGRFVKQPFLFSVVSFFFTAPFSPFFHNSPHNRSLVHTQIHINNNKQVEWSRQSNARTCLTLPKLEEEGKGNLIISQTRKEIKWCLLVANFWAVGMSDPVICGGGQQEEFTSLFSLYCIHTIAHHGFETVENYVRFIYCMLPCPSPPHQPSPHTQSCFFCKDLSHSTISLFYFVVYEQ